MVRCQACGTENAPDAAYCVKCARKLDPATQAAVVRKREEHTATGIDWSRVLLALLTVIIIAVIIAVIVTQVL